MLCVYQFKVVLRGISPMIWRRLLLRSDHSIADLHYTIQIAMGWSDSHLHRFHIHGTACRAKSPSWRSRWREAQGASDFLTSPFGINVAISAHGHRRPNRNWPV
jgi:hypothetical protein